MTPRREQRRHAQRGAAAVEFALIAMVFFVMLIGAAEMGRVLWVWNAASEATRLGARLAVVCDMNDSDIRTRMQAMLGELGTSNIVLEYLPASCTVTNCQSVTVTLTGYTQQSFIPLVDFTPALPPFRTTLSREYMTSTGNPVCN